jgi:hypothetical protein
LLKAGDRDSAITILQPTVEIQNIADSTISVQQNRGLCTSSNWSASSPTCVSCVF